MESAWLAETADPKKPEDKLIKIKPAEAVVVCPAPKCNWGLPQARGANSSRQGTNTCVEQSLNEHTLPLFC